MAASAGLISAAAMDRLRLSHFGFAATELGPEGARLAADLIDAALARVLAYKGSSDLPEIESPGSIELTQSPPMVSLDERIEEPKSPQEALNRIDEFPAEYSARQKRAGKAYERFAKDIQAADADLAVEDLTRAGVATAIAAAAPDKAAQGYSASWARPTSHLATSIILLINLLTLWRRSIPRRLRRSFGACRLRGRLLTGLSGLRKGAVRTPFALVARGAPSAA